MLQVTYSDEPTGVIGHLVVDRVVGGVAAGGLRISPTLELAELEALARNMTMKQAAVGIRVGGAKSGLRMAPDHPERAAVLRRFLRALRPLIAETYSVGPDLNNTLAELEAAGRDVGLPCLKIAVGRARGLSDAVFLQRYALLEASTAAGSVNELRAPTAVAAAVLTTLAHLGVASGDARVAVQGAGAMGGGTAKLLARAGVRITAWADDQHLHRAATGLPVDELLGGRRDGRLPAPAAPAPSAGILDEPCDVLVLAAISNAVRADDLARLRTRAVVQAANLAMPAQVEEQAHAAGILVVPDLLASAGGSLAVEALYEGAPTTGDDILTHVRERATALVAAALRAGAEQRVPLRAVVRAQADRVLRE